MYHLSIIEQTRMLSHRSKQSRLNQVETTTLQRKANDQRTAKMHSKLVGKYLVAFVILIISVQLVVGCLNENGAKQRIQSYVRKWPTIAQDATIKALFNTSNNTNTNSNNSNISNGSNSGTNTATGGETPNDTQEAAAR